jgi:endonuclease I
MARPFLGWSGYAGSLISWHEADPVDDDELEDNTLIFDFQSNRNPFIDHPEYVSSFGVAV